MSKFKKIRGFQKCKVHCRNFKGFKVTIKVRPGRDLKICNFEALVVTAMYFTFLETSNLFKFVQDRESVAICSFYDMLSVIPIDLLHKIVIVCNQKSLIVCSFWEKDMENRL